MRLSNLKLLLAISIATAALAAPTSAGAATTIGNNLSHVANNATCFALMIATSCTSSQTSLVAADQAAGGLTAPSAGVVTKWRLKTGGSVQFGAALKILNSNTALASSATESVSATAGVVEFTTRLPISAANRIGVDIYNPGVLPTIPIIYNTAAGEGVWDFWSTVLPNNTTASPSTVNNSIGLLLNADVEADADLDGFGDETQDLCPTNAALQVGCASPVKPVIGAVDLSDGNKRIYVTTSAGGKLSLKFTRKTAGRKSGGRCKPSAKTGKRCTTYVKVGSKTTVVVPGVNSVNFNAKVGGKKLRKGSYRVTVLVTSAEGLASTAKTVNFKVR